VHFLPTSEIVREREAYAPNAPQAYYEGVSDRGCIYVRDCPTCYFREERIDAKKKAKLLKAECKKAAYLKAAKRWQGIEDGTDNLV
jgi:hypothetical protein